MDGDVNRVKKITIRLGFQNAVIGCVNGVFPLTDFSYKKIYPWAFYRTNKMWPLI